jgi:cardiolipin synthase
MVAGHSDVPIAAIVGQTYFERMRRKGIKIFLFEPTMLHAKYMVVDNTICWIGTGNWSHDYFYNSRDLTLIIQSQTCGKQLDSVFQQDWNGPYVSLIK